MGFGGWGGDNLVPVPLTAPLSAYDQSVAIAARVSFPASQSGGEDE